MRRVSHDIGLGAGKFWPQQCNRLLFRLSQWNDRDRQNPNAFCDNTPVRRLPSHHRLDPHAFYPFVAVLSGQSRRRCRLHRLPHDKLANNCVAVWRVPTGLRGMSCKWFQAGSAQEIWKSGFQIYGQWASWLFGIMPCLHWQLAQHDQGTQEQRATIWSENSDGSNISHLLEVRREHASELMV